MKPIHNAYYQKIQLSLYFSGVTFTVLELWQLITNGIIDEFSVSILELKFASTKCHETYIQCTCSLPQNSDQVLIWKVSLLPFLNYVPLLYTSGSIICVPWTHSQS